jgi:hypothetical protein
MSHRYTPEQVAHIKENLKPVDVDEKYREFIDECEPVVKVAGISFTPSRILEELDPTAFNCGVSNFSDTADLEEIEGDYYESGDVSELIEEWEQENDNF